jgi:hypothetical protein
MTRPIHWIYDLLFRFWRSARFARFKQLIAPTLDDTILDVGGMPSTWTAHERVAGRIDVLNTHAIEPGEARDSHGVRTLVGDGCRLPFGDRSYAIVFSNSVIEHVGGWDRQAAFAREACRVGRALWIQTPAMECPVEPHFLAPFVHYLPRRVRPFVVRWLTPRGLIDRLTAQEAASMVDSIRLLTKREMRQLFPDCSIHVERLFGVFPKSYIAVRRKTSAPQTAGASIVKSTDKNRETEPEVSGSV